VTQSLRGRLLLGLVSLAVVGLLVVDVATYLLLQQRLLSRVDSQLADAARVLTACYGGEPGRRQPPPQLPSATYVALLDANGNVIDSHCSFADRTSPFASSAKPERPSPLPVDGNPVTVSGTGGVEQYRMVAVSGHAVATGAPVTGIVAIPTTDVQSTLQGLLVLEAIISAVVLLAMGLLAWWIIRVGLRPLERMGATAGAIAAGELSRRVEPATPRTEIGRLGLALNGMLSQIETAFAERTRSEQRLRRFLADASHELRTPLTSIRGYAELLRRGNAQPPEDAATARRRIEQEAVRMSVLVDDLLLLARLDQGRPLVRAPVDLQVIARDACADAGAAAPRRAITLTAPEHVVVAGDELRLRQVVGNLVSNAVVHTPAETPIEVGVGREDGRAVLTVADHGPGLDAEEARRVFEPFYRADQGRSRDRGGAGLGLSIVAAVVAAHGGRVQVSDTEGGGATFRVDLPLGAAS
jgi:two-component system, OmpR family, sensor kinase